VPSEPIRCLYCGAEQPSPAPGRPAQCTNCKHPLTRKAETSDTPPPPPPPAADPSRGRLSPSEATSKALAELLAVTGPPQDVPVRKVAGGEPAPARPAAQLPASSRTSQALAELISAGPPSEAPAMVGELIAAEKRGNSIVAFIPFIGPWILYRSESHTPAEKRRLAVVSLTLTLLACVTIWSFLPEAVDEAVKLHDHVRADLQVLGAAAADYRNLHHDYPDEKAWRRFSQRADPRFFDPWGRPYGYQRDDHGIRIFTYGRDGVPGGSGQEEDMSAEFSPQS
jgi:type II secretion system (T2SS) protein G